MRHHRMGRIPFEESSVVVTALATKLMWSTASVIDWLDQLALTERGRGMSVMPSAVVPGRVTWGRSN